MTITPFRYSPSSDSFLVSGFEPHLAVTYSILPRLGTNPAAAPSTSFTVFRDDMVWTLAEPEATVQGAVETTGTRGIEPGTIVRLAVC